MVDKEVKKELFYRVDDVVTQTERALVCGSDIVTIHEALAIILNKLEDINKKLG